MGLGFPFVLCKRGLSHMPCEILHIPRDILVFPGCWFALANSVSVWFILSATPFWGGEYGAVNLNSIPCSLHHRSNFSFTNSLPRSICIAFGIFPRTFRYVR